MARILVQDPISPFFSYWVDLDNDGDLDVFSLVDNDSPDRFYRNEGGGSFIKITEGDWLNTRNSANNAVFGDYDNDGDLDVLYHCWKLDSAGILYRNERGRGFNNVGYLLPANGQIRVMGAAWGDYDNDGHIDLLVGNTGGKNLLYHNEGNGSFKRIENSPVVELGLRTGAISWVDIDRDGDLDLFVGNGMFSEYEESCELFLNTGGRNNWIVVELEGTISNRFGIGAKIWVNATIDNRRITQLRELQVGGNEDGSGHFGLGDAEDVESLRIDWPSGHVQELWNLEPNQYLRLTEDVTIHPNAPE